MQWPPTVYRLPLLQGHAPLSFSHTGGAYSGFCFLPRPLAILLRIAIPKPAHHQSGGNRPKRLAHQHAMPAISMSPFACTGLTLRRAGQGVEMCPMCRYKAELPLNRSLQGQSGLPVRGLSPTLHTSMAAIPRANNHWECDCDLKGLWDAQSKRQSWLDRSASQPSN